MKMQVQHSLATIRLPFRISLIGLLVLGTGCASIMDNGSSKKSKKDKDGWSFFKKKEYQEPKSLVAIWTEDNHVQPGKAITRGFGGRLYFYNEKSQAIPVDGELIVYGYEDNLNLSARGEWPSDAEMSNGTKKFRFTAEQFTQHFSESQLGASYSIWIPWDAVGSMHKKIVLCPMFISKDQRVTRGEAAKLTLSGKKTNENLVNQNATGFNLQEQTLQNNMIQLASANFPAVDPNVLPQMSASPLQARTNTPIQSNMQTTTIKLDRAIQPTTNAPIPSSVPAMTAQAAQMLQALQMQQAQQAALANAAVTQNLNGLGTPMNASLIPPVQPSTPIQQSTLWSSLIPPAGNNVPTTDWGRAAPSLGSLPANAAPVGFPPNQFQAPN